MANPTDQDKESRQDDASLSTRDGQSKANELTEMEQLKALLKESREKEKAAESREKEKAKEIAKLKDDLSAVSTEKAKEIAKLKDDLSAVSTVEMTYGCKPIDGNCDNDKKRKREYSLPPIDLNGLVEPHNDKPKQKIKATIKRSDAWSSVGKVVIPTRLVRSDNKSVLVNSILGAKALDHNTGRMKALRYVNEASVQDFVKAQVEDAVNCLGLGNFLKVHVEMSIFSEVPDLVVVSLNDRPIAFVEVKSPERPGHPGEVFGNEDVATQVWSYLMGLKKIGHSIPIGFLSTYNQLAIITTEDLSEGNHKNIVAETVEDLSTGTRDIVTVKDEKKQSCQDDNDASPTKNKTKLSNETRNKADDDDDRDEKPIVFMTGQFGEGEIMQALLAGLLASYKHNDYKDKEKLIVVGEQEDLSGIFTPRVSNDGIVWTTIRKGVKASYNTFPRSDANNFYLLAHVGRGSCGKLLLASTLGGFLCAMKLYIPQRSNRYTSEERKAEDAKNWEAKKAARDEEESRWKKLYQDKHCQSKTINNLPALLMVYGHQLEQSDRKEKLGEVKRELVRFADEGFAYKDSDLRWRHVVLYKNTIMLVDLESLEDISLLAPEERNKRVEKQIQRLHARMGTEKALELDQNLLP